MKLTITIEGEERLLSRPVNIAITPAIGDAEEDAYHEGYADGREDEAIDQSLGYTDEEEEEYDEDAPIPTLGDLIDALTAPNPVLGDLSFKPMTFAEAVERAEAKASAPRHLYRAPFGALVTFPDNRPFGQWKLYARSGNTAYLSQGAHTLVAAADTLVTWEGPDA